MKTQKKHSFDSLEAAKSPPRDAATGKNPNSPASPSERLRSS